MPKFLKSLVLLVLVPVVLGLTLACGGGGGGGSAPPPPPPLPAITSFLPTSGQVGASVVITGMDLTGTNSVVFGGISSTPLAVNGSTQIVATVPNMAVTGTISVSTPNGTGTSTGSFTVLPSLPTITSINPTQGPVGTRVIIKGTNFVNNPTVVFNGHAATLITYVSFTELQAVVPSGATTGLIVVDNGTVPTSSPTAFTVGGSTPFNMFVDSAYITQSAQNYTGTVPLIANRDGYLRIFVRSNQPNSATPIVRVSFGSGSPVDLPAPIGLAGVPVSINEGDLTKSWNLSMAGSSLSAGTMTVSIQIDQPGTYPEADKGDNFKTLTLNINNAKVFATTIIPVVQSGRTGNVDSARTLTDWVDRFQRMYPIQNMSGGIDVRKGATYTTTANLNTGDSATPLVAQEGWEKLLFEIEGIRAIDAPTRYYYGAVNVSYINGIAGLGYLGLPSAIGWDKIGYLDGGNFPEIFAHEVGHNFNRGHAPCDVSPADPYPYPGGRIGVWGWDWAYATSASPDATTPLRNPSVYGDIMGYCSPVWVSDYTYKAIMDFRDASPIGAVVNAATVQQDCLLVSGRIRNGQVSLEPAFKVTTLPQLPTPGAYTLQLYDGRGAALVETPFKPAEIADLPRGSEQHFVFTIPLNANLEAALAGMRVLEGGAVRATRVASPLASSLAAGMGGVREPVSVRMRPGQAHLSWDPMAHPKVMVRDPRTGEVISFADGGSLDLVTDATELDVTFSDGVRSTRRLLKMQ